MKNTITTSLELSKALEKAGYKQESLFYWIKEDGELNLVSQSTIPKDKLEYGIKNNLIHSSPTAEEILEELPVGVHIFKNNGDKKERQYTCYFRVPGGIEWKPLQMKQLKFFADTPANALAKLFIYLKEEGVL